jgi:hypothetical protein
MRLDVLFYLSTLLILLVLPSCVNPARAPCLTSCSQEKDTCMLEATTAAEIQACDGNETICGGACPQ